MVDKKLSPCNYLIFETSSRVGAIALGTNDSILLSRTLTESRRNASDLTRIVGELVTDVGWKMNQIDGIIVSLGPGSFTSLRVGMMSAKALAYVNQCTMYAVGTFDAIVHQSPDDVQSVFVISDALQGNVYSARYVRDNLDWAVCEPLGVRPFQSIVDQLSSDTKLSGPGLLIHSDRINPKVTLPRDCWQPNCVSLFQLVKLNPSHYVCDPWVVEPIYLRGSSAEEKRNKQLVDKPK